jgi:hypothetical protein
MVNMPLAAYTPQVHKFICFSKNGFHRRHRYH